MTDPKDTGNKGILDYSLKEKQYPSHTPKDADRAHGSTPHSIQHEEQWSHESPPFKGGRFILIKFVRRAVGSVRRHPWRTLAGTLTVAGYFVTAVGDLPALYCNYIQGACDSTASAAVNGRIFYASGLTGRTAEDSVGESDIYSMNSNGSGLQRIPLTGAEDNMPKVSPDGSTIALVSLIDGNFEVYLVGVDGAGGTNVSKNSARDIEPAWAPSGDRIAFASDRDGDFDIYVMDIRSRIVRQLVDDPATDDQPSWSRDGTRLAFSSNRTGNREIFLMRSDGRGERQFTYNARGEDQWPAWSPDDRQIAYHADDDGDNEIYTSDSDGRNNYKVTRNDGVADALAAWSPDGQRIAFASDREGDLDIYSMSADGTDVVRLTSGPTNDWFPDWAAASPSQVAQ